MSGDVIVEDHITELSHIKIHRVKVLDEPLQVIRELFQRIKNRGKVHPGGSDRAVYILDIPKEHIGSSEEQPDAEAKQVQRAATAA